MIDIFTPGVGLLGLMFLAHLLMQTFSSPIVVSFVLVSCAVRKARSL